MDSVSIVGLGLVGIALARRLLAAGFAVRGHDIDATRCALLVDAGGDAVPVVSALACRTVVLAVFDDVQAESVLAGPIATSAVVVDTVTGDPQFAAKLAAHLARRGVHYVDAPLSGSSAQIADGEAHALLGGEETVIRSRQAVLDAIARSSMRFGPAGAGRAAKLASNLILGLNRAAFAEGLALAERLGLDPGQFAAFVAESPARSAAAQSKARRMLSRDFAPESRIRQHRKDLRLVERAAAWCGASIALGTAHAAVLDAAIAAGDGDLDNAAIIEQYRRQQSTRRG